MTCAMCLFVAALLMVGCSNMQEDVADAGIPDSVDEQPQSLSDLWGFMRNCISDRNRTSTIRTTSRRDVRAPMVSSRSA